MVSLVDGCVGGFLESLSKLAPEAVEHEFGSGFTSGILRMRLGLRSLSSLSLCRLTYWTLSSGMTPQQGIQWPLV